jgi:hypothetical protein
MRFTSFTVINFRSFRKPTTIELAPGLNVIVGQNNVGKTALLEALRLNFENEPHRSLETLPTPTSRNAQESAADFSFGIEPEELIEILAQHGPFYLAAPGGEDAPLQGRALAAWIPGIRSISAKFQRSVPIVSASIAGEPAGDAQGLSLQFMVEAVGDRTPRYTGDPHYSRVDARSRLPYNLARIFLSRIYSFNAERMKIGQHRIGTNEALAADASNLPEVLHLLASRHPGREAKFERYLRYVRAVFPHLKYVSIPNINDTTVEILLWNIDTNTDRRDLAIQLDKSGTGIGQVLALLYVVVTAQYPQVILIDEPASFLHPGAVRKLLEIFLLHPQHQYIISTHSPMVVGSPATSRLLLVQMPGVESEVKSIDPREPSSLTAVLAEVGARLSDVYGADSILWVEGRTEEACFPIIRQLALTTASAVTGAAILGVRQTGDLEGRDAQRVIEIYERLTTASTLLPVVTGFLFDREAHTEAERADLLRRTSNRISFLPRRMFENYLLVPEAIAATLDEKNCCASDIARWIEEHRWDQKYLRPLEVTDRAVETWEAFGNGALLLRDLFSRVSENRTTYDKVRHGLALTKWIVTNQPDLLRPLAILIEGIIAGTARRA